MRNTRTSTLPSGNLFRLREMDDKPEKQKRHHAQGCSALRKEVSGEGIGRVGGFPLSFERSGRVASEWGPEAGELRGVWGMGIPGREKSQCRGPEAGACLYACGATKTPVELRQSEGGCVSPLRLSQQVP